MFSTFRHQRKTAGDDNNSTNSQYETRAAPEDLHIYRNGSRGLVSYTDNSGQALGSTTATDNENTMKQYTNLQFDTKNIIKHWAMLFIIKLHKFIDNRNNIV